MWDDAESVIGLHLGFGKSILSVSTALARERGSGVGFFPYSCFWLCGRVVVFQWMVNGI